MNFSTYQDVSSRTLPSKPKYMDKSERLVLALGLCGESGELGDLIKKIEGHGHAIDRDKLASEIGDVLWYLAAVATAYGIDLGEAAGANVDKLRRRYPNGFNTEASVKRVDTQRM